MLRGGLKLALAVGEISAGMTMFAGAAAGEFFSVGLSTPVSIIVGTAGVVTMMDGFARAGLALADITAETADACGKEVIDGDVIPSSLGGLVGAVIDKRTGVAFSDTGKVGPSQKTGEKINAGVTFLSSTASYVDTITSAPSAVNAVINEVQHQYDIFDTTKHLLNKRSFYVLN